MNNEIKIPIIVGIIVIPLFAFFCYCMVTSGEEYTINNVRYVDAEPAPETTSSVILVFESDDGQVYKLYAHEEKLRVMKENNRYDVKYMMDTLSYPYDNIMEYAVPK